MASSWQVSSGVFLSLVSVLGCSGGSLSPDARIAVTVPDQDVAPICPADAATEAASSECWATGRLTTSTGCSDTHCERDGSLWALTVDYASCGLAGPDPTSDAQPGDASPAGALSVDDDQCEFHAEVTPVCASGARALFFDVDLSTMIGGPVPSGAQPYIEAFSSPTHLAPSTGSSTEMSPGRYRIGPATFDVSGLWSVTLHFFGTCRDESPNSPHAHVTFTLQVP